MKEPLHLLGLQSSVASYVLRKLYLGEDFSSYVIHTADGVISKPVASTRVASPLVSQGVVVVTPDIAQAERLVEDLRLLLPNESTVRILPGWDVLPFDPLSPSINISAERLLALSDLAERRPAVTVVSADTLLSTFPRPERVRKSIIRMAVRDEIDREGFLGKLEAIGYTHASIVEELGQMAVRGAVIDLYSPGYSSPVRIELKGDVVKEIRLFDPETQRSYEKEKSKSVQELRIIPVTEVLFSYHEDESPDLGRKLWSLSARNALRSRAEVLEIPKRILEPIEEVLQSGGGYPGLEHLVPILDRERADLSAYFSDSTRVVLVDELGIQGTIDSFHELIGERARVSQEEGRLFPEVESAYRMSGDPLQEFKERADLFFDSVRLLEISESEIERSVRQTTHARLQITSQSELRDALRRSRHGEFPLKPVAEQLRRDRELGFTQAIACSQPQRAKRLLEMLQGYAIRAEILDTSLSSWLSERGEQTVSILQGTLTEGIRSPREKISVVSEHDIFPDLSHRKPARSVKAVRRFLGSLGQIKEGDFIVHIDHGVGRYLGLREIAVEGKVSDFLQLEYQDGAKLFVPVENIGKVQKYVGAEGANPQLSKLGGKKWSETKEKVKQQIQELAGQLLNLYAERELLEGISYGSKNEDDEEFAETFPYQETADQQKAIDEVLADLGKDRPMDRLVCGDVGFGKTEVAIRAAFKAANSGKQVAFLVPTTILADQHYVTFKERFRDYPIEVGCVSRFSTPQENRKTIEKLASGALQIVIGTHRILQKDVQFKDLGLLMIDEEHKFGVADKERLKRMRREVHVLTLTATPIPRTLYMSLFDIRDLSVIETPPTDRQVIRTYVSPYQGSVVREAILRELGRQGQVFFIHNRVGNIAMVADELRELIPEARIEFAHGQMREDQLEKVMHRFVSHEFDVLVSTTIVESGLDISNANTIIIKDSDMFGLAELYQLRGRVGRSSRRAYAYLLISDSKVLGAEAKKRLQVLQSLDDLGQGFRLALQDMEIRGAGNLLGKDQSGKIELVGFELYSRILKEAVRELRSRAKSTPDSLRQALELSIDPELNIGFAAHIPTYYIPDVEERLLMYQRLVDIRSAAEAEEISEEIVDRFGAMPPEVVTLLEVMVFRSVLRRGGIIQATFRGDLLTITFHRQANIDIEKLMFKVAGSLGKLKLSPGMVLSARVPNLSVDSPSVLTEWLSKFLRGVGSNVAEHALGDLQ